MNFFKKTTKMPSIPDEFLEIYKTKNKKEIVIGLTDIDTEYVESVGHRNVVGTAVALAYLFAVEVFKVKSLKELNRVLTAINKDEMKEMPKNYLSLFEEYEVLKYKDVI